MEDAFEKLKKEGKNDVDHLIKWMKDSKIIDDTKAGEEKARALFKDAANKQAIELSNFKAALTKLAAEQNKSLDEFSKALASKGEKFKEALGAAATAFKDAMKK